MARPGSLSDGKRLWNKEEDLPVYLARPGTTAQTPRQKYGGMFCTVEGAYESKTIDFDAYSVGRRSSKASRSASRHDILSPESDGMSETASDTSEISGSVISSPSEREERAPLEIRPATAKALLQGWEPGKVQPNLHPPPLSLPLNEPNITRNNKTKSLLFFFFCNRVISVQFLKSKVVKENTSF